jgi:hypothetical protein
MLDVTSTYERYRTRLEKDDLGTTIWAYFCIGLFLVVMIVSLLQ